MTEEPGRRLFIAVPLSSDACADIARLVEVVRDREDAAAALAAVAPANGRRAPWQVRWVRLDGLHLTLRFLGPTADPRVDMLKAVVDDVADAAPFEVRIGEAGAFPDHRHPRTLWLRVLDGTPELERLAGLLGDRLSAAGWPRDDRPFRAHLTLARADGIRSGPRVVEDLVAAASDFETRFEADRIVLFESHTGGGPARYEALHEAPLRG
ncbi:MAG TPA: RNA 2',3'-cyclic phosphodiesterase [Candidatus Limnocylindrales bacterium]